MGSLPTQTIPASSGGIPPHWTHFRVDKSPFRTEAFRHFTSAMQNVILAINYLIGKNMWQGAHTTIFLANMPGFYWCLLVFICLIVFLLFVFMCQGAQTTIFLAVKPGLEKERGGFFADCRNCNFILSK